MEECSICLDLYIDKCVTSCNHSFCKKCLNKWFSKKKITCPIC